VTDQSSFLRGYLIALALSAGILGLVVIALHNPSTAFLVGCSLVIMWACTQGPRK